MPTFAVNKVALSPKLEKNQVVENIKRTILYTTSPYFGYTFSPQLKSAKLEENLKWWKSEIFN